MNKEQMVVNAIRILSAEAVQKAKSGHPGMPMGAAAMAYAVWGREMTHNPADPKFVNRDRFVLSSGHGSMLIYSLLHLFGYGLTIDDLKAFRQFGSKTPGHPEYKHTVGVETTTGPLGQGIANAVGMAMAEKHLAAKFNREGFNVVDHYTYCILGDGCMMEGISHEACSLAGTLKLNKLIALYDDNEISIEGNTDIAFREDVPARFRAYGWNVIDVKTATASRKWTPPSAWPRIRTSPTSSSATPPSATARPRPAGKRPRRTSGRGEPRGDKKNLGWPETEPSPFRPASTNRPARQPARAEAQKEWNDVFAKYAKKYPELKKEWTCGSLTSCRSTLLNDKDFWASRARARPAIPPASSSTAWPSACPTSLAAPRTWRLQQEQHEGQGRLLRRDARGQQHPLRRARTRHGGHLQRHPPARRPAPLLRHLLRVQRLHEERHAHVGHHGPDVPYILTHDSIGVGEDGPTHQPIEQLAGLRAMPGLTVFRPPTARKWPRAGSPP